ncbi:uncharacterized protein RCC_06266 [Ramularia collo-cygni]|uniref:AAA+ ATPase domain-containing protein n=1 Tax=Ramularia collo-cygni TaxID=112498 RepID=A0A2D3V9V2_9PEZI|nr:uncharacterized protein RCC_06266 [Ramularia collo-cygni]CZT20406.1 uncharacterized protein RCC_06266 [Ramularia collo-cygni]
MSSELYESAPESLGNEYEIERQRLQQFFTAAGTRNGRQEEFRTTPLFSLAVKHVVDGGNAGTAPEVLPQYGLLGFHIGENENVSEKEPLHMNVDAPNSAFICGSQGSGKSYTLSCMLENCLLSSPDTGRLRAPVAGVVFHYDINSTPAPAEAAYLCSRGIEVNVFVSRSAGRALNEAYKNLGDKYGNLKVQPLMFRSSDLSIERMNRLMAVATKEGPPPLYMEVVQRILRDLAINSEVFDYLQFKKLLANEQLTKDQTSPMSLRLGLLESFMDPSSLLGSGQSFNGKKFYGHKSGSKDKGSLNPQPGSLTIIDLSDTFVDSSTVCLLFDMCLGLVKEQRPEAGLVIGLDEAHKYMNKDKSTSAALFTDSLLTTIREQRHNSTRVFIATQEPTISERLLDLCSITIVHRFSSPAWFGSIKDHLGGASSMVSTKESQYSMFERIVNLDVGESLVFAPSAFVGLRDREVTKLGAVALLMKTRARLGTDGGTSKLATGSVEQ